MDATAQTMLLKGHSAPNFSDGFFRDQQRGFVKNILQVNHWRTPLPFARFRRAMEKLAKRFTIDPIIGLGQLAFLCRDIFESLVKHRVEWRNLIYQIYFVGVKSQSVVLITGAFTGMVLCAQAYLQFHKVKMDTATLAVVSVSMGSQLGPVLTALMVAGRVGAAMAAELGTMKVTEQIDALRTLAAHPVDYLVVPRILATVIPCRC